MTPTPAFAFLRAMGGVRPDQKLPPKSAGRLSDPAIDIVTQALISAGLWRWDMSVSLERDGARHKFRVFIPEQQQSDRLVDNEHATKTKAVVEQRLREAKFGVRVADILFCERGKKGHEVLVKAVEMNR